MTSNDKLTVELLSERIARKVCVDEFGCWEWVGSTSESRGRRHYGILWVGGKNKKAHRVVYEELVGPIPEGLTLDHLCKNTICVNPSHLGPVTIAENILRGVGPPAQNSRKTHCIHGHEFNEENTYVTPQNGFRQCLTCQRIGRRRRYLESGR